MKQFDKHEMNMCEGPILPKLIKYAIPLIVTNMLQLLFNAADIAVLGNFAQEAKLAQAAVGSTSALINLLIGLFVGLSVGANVLVARCVGQNDQEKSRRIVGTSVIVSLIVGVVLLFVGVFGAKFFLSLLIDTDATDPKLLDKAVTYLKIYFLGLPIMMLYNFTASILRAVGDTKRPLMFLCIGGVLNICLNLFFVLVLHKDVEGVATATVASQGLSAILTTITLIRSTGFSKLERKHLHIYNDVLDEIVKIGLPAGLQGCLFNLSSVILQSAITSFGDTITAANTIAMQFDSFIYNGVTAISLSALAFVGQNLGAKKMDRVKKSIWISLGFSVLVSVVLGWGMALLGKPLSGIFTSDADVIEAVCERLFVTTTLYFLCAIMDLIGNVMRGMGKSFIAMLVTLCGSCLFRIVWVKWLFPHASYTLLLAVYPVSWLLTIAIYLVIIFPVLHNIEKQLGKNSDICCEKQPQNSCN